MRPQTIETSSELDAWLDQHHRFEDCHLMSVRAEGSEGQPETIAFELGRPIAGSYEANAELTLQVFALTASGLTAWYLPDKLGTEVYRTLESIESEAADSGLRITIDDDFYIHCTRLQVTRLPDCTEIVPARASDQELYATIEHQPLPTPSDWVEWLGHHGEEAVWRMYGEPARPPGHVPEANYEGWFLQSADTVAATTEGLFIFHCRTQGSGFVLDLRRGNASDSLWTAMGKVIGHFPSVEVESGNCRFTREEWLEHLD